MNNIPKKKNNRKPTSKKGQSTEKENANAVALQNALIQALIDDEKEEENKLKEEIFKSNSNSVDRSEMWQQEINATVLKSPKERSLETIEDKWSGSENKKTQGLDNKPLWIVSVFLGLLLIFGGWFAFKALKDNNKQTQEQLISEEINVGNESTIALATEVGIISEVLKDYLTATSIDEKCKSIYKADEFESEIEAYYEKNELKPMGDFEISGIQPVLFDSNEYWEVNVMDNSGNESLYYLRTDEKQSVKIDWKADVIFQKNNIQSFIKSRSKKPHLFRVYFTSKILPVYAWGFTEKEYLFVNLNIPNTESYLWGYIKRDSEVSDKLEELIKESFDHRITSKKSLDRFLVEIRFKEDSEVANDQAVVIDRIISNSWVNTEE